MPDLNEPLTTPKKCRTAPHTAGFTGVKIRGGQDGGDVPTAEEGWDRTWPGLADRFDIRLAPEPVARLRAVFLADAALLATDRGIYLERSRHPVVVARKGADGSASRPTPSTAA